MDLWTPAELAIYNAMREVEKMPASVTLTNAVIKLNEAQSLVADFLDGEQVDSPIDSQQSKTGVCSGDWYSDEHGNRITVLSVVDGWCMVREGDKKPFVVPEEFVLGTFDKSTAQ
jgi:hypothetical protein